MSAISGRPSAWAGERLAGPLLCASAGALIAAAIACWIWPITDQAAPLTRALLPSHWNQFHPEPREFHFLAMAAVLGGAGALLGALLDRPRPRPAIALSVGAFLAVALDVLFRFALSVPTAATTVTAIAVCWTAVVIWMLAHSHPARRGPALSGTPDRADRSPDRQTSTLKQHLVPVGILLVLLAPSSLQAVAAKIGYEMHVVSFIIGPALYSFIPGLVPGIDYFTQYSVGLPYLFSYLLGGTADATVLHYVALIVTAMLVYYAGTYYFLRWLFRSWHWALAVTVVAVLLQFHTDRIFFDPSSYVLRHPLLIGVVAMLGWWAGYGLEWKRGALLAAAVGLSLFLNTETGIYQLLMVMAVAVFAAPSFAKGSAVAAAILLGAFSALMALCLFAFGSQVLSLDFLRYYAEPLFIYSAGFGGWPVDWSYGWPVYYNVIAPGLALATIGWGFVWLKRIPQDAERARIAALSGLACAAIMLSAKYWNMSLIALWHVSALPFLTITAWWYREALGHGTGEIGPAPSLRKTGVAALAVGAFWLLAFAGDARNPTYYGLRAYLKYPSAWSASLRRHPGCRNLACSAPRLATEDVRLIDTLTRPDERVAVLDWNDWAYLIDARRAPKSFFLPSFATFTHRQLDNTLAGLNLLFVAVDAHGKYVITPPELEARLAPLLQRDYTLVGKGTNLVALRREGR